MLPIQPHATRGTSAVTISVHQTAVETFYVFCFDLRRPLACTVVRQREEKTEQIAMENRKQKQDKKRR